MEFRSRRGFLDQLDIKKDELSMGSKPPVGIWSFGVCFGGSGHLYIPLYTIGVVHIHMLKNMFKNMF